jgi:hypothetical protein
VPPMLVPAAAGACCAGFRLLPSLLILCACCACCLLAPCPTGCPETSGIETPDCWGFVVGQPWSDRRDCWGLSATALLGSLCGKWSSMGLGLVRQPCSGVCPSGMSNLRGEPGANHRPLAFHHANLMSHIAFCQPMASVRLLYQAHLYSRLIDMPLHP